ncbi:hypothetical protein HDV62DRAFT_337498 [Trichoderma sp. SZMC 28011]
MYFRPSIAFCLTLSHLPTSDFATHSDTQLFAIAFPSSPSLSCLLCSTSALFYPAWSFFIRWLPAPKHTHTHTQSHTHTRYHLDTGHATKYQSLFLSSLFLSPAA